MGCSLNKRKFQLRCEVNYQYFVQQVVFVPVSNKSTCYDINNFIKINYLRPQFKREVIKLKFYYNGQLMSENVPLMDYGIDLLGVSNKDPLTLQTQSFYFGSACHLKVNVRCLIQNKQITLKVFQNSQILKLYQTAQPFFKGQEPKIYFKFQELEPDYTIANYGLKSGDTIDLIIASQNDRLLIKGNCQNPQCHAFQQEVISSQGFGFFSLSKLLKRVSCPICSTKLSSKNQIKDLQYAFNSCYYKITTKLLYSSQSSIAEMKKTKGAKIKWQKFFNFSNFKDMKFYIRHLSLKIDESFQDFKKLKKRRESSFLPVDYPKYSVRGIIAVRDYSSTDSSEGEPDQNQSQYSKLLRQDEFTMKKHNVSF